MTSGQKNALAAGQDYIDMSGMSKAGLIEQLSFFGRRRFLES